MSETITHADEAASSGIEVSEELPLLSTQYGLWLDSVEIPENPAMVSGAVLDVEGVVDAEALVEATSRAMNEHQVLTAEIVVRDGVPLHRTRPGRRVPVERFTLDEADATGDAWHHRRLTRGMDLSGDTSRASVLDLGADRWQVFLEGHHLVADGYTAGLIGMRLAEHYRALLDGSTLVPVPSLGRLVAEDQTYLASQDFLDDEAYWSEQVAGRGGFTTYGARGDAIPLGELRVQRRIGAADLQEVRAHAHELGVSWPVLALTAAGDAVGRATGQREIALTLPVSRRLSDVSRLTGGMFANFLPMFLDLSPWASLGDRATDNAAQFKRMLRHQRYPAGNVRRLIGMDAGDRRPFGPTVNILNYAASFDLGEGITASFRDVSSGPVEDVQLTFQLRNDGSLDLYTNVNPELYDRADAESALDDVFETFARMGAPDAPRRTGSTSSTLEKVSPGAPETGAGADGSSSPEADVLVALTRQARRAPGSLAVVDDHGSLTYAQLHDQVVTFTAQLVAAGVVPGDVVALRRDPSARALAEILAVWAAGAAYCPVPTQAPASRVDDMLADSGARFVLGSDPATVLADDVQRLDLDAAASGLSAAPWHQHSGQDLAYVIFTSGSTGRPKGAMVEWAGLTNHLYAKVEDLALTPADRTAMTAPMTFDISVWQLLAPILSGGSVHVLSRDAATDAFEVGSVVADSAITVLELVPSLLRPLVEGWRSGSIDAPRHLRHVLSTGEELPRDLCELWARAHREVLQADASSPSSADGVALTNAYGPTECSDDVTHWTWSADDPLPTHVPIGRAVRGTRLYVLDASLRPVTSRGRGELYVGGICVGRGYVGRSGLTAERFVADPFAGPGRRMYRTGDRVEVGRDGNLRFVERVDHQVKLRGFRIELAEIEAALRQVDGVDDAAVCVAGEGEHRHLAGHVVTERDPADVARALGALLPTHMIPSAWSVLSELPLSANGKVDRRQLPTAVVSASAPSGEPPVTADEMRVAAAMTAILGVATVGRHDDFFALGGNSLLATRLVAHLRADAGLSISLRELFAGPTLAQIARSCLPDADRRAPEAIRSGVTDRAVASPGQARLWALHEVSDHSAAYHVAVRLTLDAEVDLARLRRSFEACVGRHEALRTTATWVDGVRAQHVEAPLASALDWTLSHASSPDAWTRALVTDPMDLSRSPLRLGVRELPNGGAELIVVIHHSACDGWSLRLLMTDVAAAYLADGTLAPTDETTRLRYLDYAVWQASQQVQTSTWLQGQRDFWAEQLADPTDSIDWGPLAPGSVPAASPGPVATSYVRRAGVLDLELSSDLVGALRQVCSANGTTLYSALHTALAAAVTDLTGTGDLLVGAVNHGRAHASFESIVGFFANTLPLRTVVDPGTPWEAHLRRNRDLLMEALDHGSLPYDDIVAQTPRELPRPTLQVVLAFQQGMVTMPGMEAEALPTGVARFDLALECDQASAPDGAIRCHLEHASDALTSHGAATLMARFETLLHAIATSPASTPGSTPLVGQAVAEQLLSDGNVLVGGDASDDGTGSSTHRSALALVEAAMAAAGDAPALSRDGTTLGNDQLLGATASLAAHLLDHGAGLDRVVAVVLPASLEWVVSLVAAMRSGSTFVCLDPQHPDDHLVNVLRETSPTVVLTDDATATRLDATSWATGGTTVLTTSAVARLPETTTSLDTRVDPGPDDLAYLIYTSGSTGRPKAAAVTQAGLRDLALFQTTQYPTGSRVLQFAGVGFDAAVWEVCTALVVGGEIVVPTSEQRMPGQPLSDFLRSARITVACLPPTVLATLPDGDPLPDLQILVAGEHCSDALADRWARRVTLRNAYGPCEATVCSTISEPIVQGGGVDIGRPLPQVSTLVLDPQLRLVPPGVTGELYLGGVALARGYVGQSAMTASRFVADPFGPAGARLYRTGDLAAWTTEGTLQFKGRNDAQVKIRGVRVDPEQVRAALAAMAFVADAVVVARPDHVGELRLVAYVVYVDDLPIDSAAVRTRLEASLPAQSVPHRVMSLSEIPRTANEKVDTSRLPDPFESGAVPDDAVDALATADGADPAQDTDLTRRLGDLFGEALGCRSLGPDDDFLRHGGDSISAVRLVALARRAGLVVTAQQVLEHRTPRALAEIAAEADHSAGGGGPAEVEPAAGVALLPPVGQWLSGLGSSVADFAQSGLFALATPVEVATVRSILVDLVQAHPTLRARLERPAEGWSLRVPEEDRAAAGAYVDAVLTVQPTTTRPEDSTDARLWLGHPLDPDAGRMMRVALFCSPSTSTDAAHGTSARVEAIGLDLHHLVVDGVSWRILLDDLGRLLAGESLDARARTPFRQWSAWLQTQADDERWTDEAPLWRRRLRPLATSMGGLELDASRDVGSSAVGWDQSLSGDDVRRLLDLGQGSHGHDVETIVLGAYAWALARVQVDAGSAPDLLIGLESHGRPADAGPLDVSETLGWFTCEVPTRLDLTAHRSRLAEGFDDAVGRAILSGLREQRAEVGGSGLGYGLLRHAPTSTTSFAGAATAPWGFNYLGRLQSAGSHDPVRALAPVSGRWDPQLALPHLVALNAVVVADESAPRLDLTWTRAGRLVDEQTQVALAALFGEALHTLLDAAEGRPASRSSSAGASLAAEAARRGIDL